MKKLAILFAATAGVVFINGQKIQQKDIPGSVQFGLQKQFPDAKNVKWEKENGNYEAGFKSKGTEYSVLLNASGSIMETEIPVSINSLSAPIKQFIAQKYPNQKIKEAAKITDAKGIVTYEAETGGKDLIFDSKGNFLREIKD
ncbi:hypothetical protein M2347_003475 [Chryseobacterium sp. H1D6B]|uniref:PepSY-like domain-containing protein n=1 Tax=Chryseobacterium sp. H1D6B TaxID=2940588 RepID=UPI0015C794C8|nr:PepSY-like domain-containing protein [Chryseobacterium sp. H1D6B]MDH6253748.1 hypothetical protein [Chryseobacterium sp. H1D6B]